MSATYNIQRAPAFAYRATEGRKTATTAAKRSGSSMKG
jgi:hypothetical protein